MWSFLSLHLSCGTGFSHQQAAVCQRHSPLQTDGGKVCSTLAASDRSGWKGVLLMNEILNYCSQTLISYVVWVDVMILQVLRWHQADYISQRPGDELGVGRAVQGEWSLTSSPAGRQAARRRLTWRLCVSELLRRAELPGGTARALQIHQQVLRPGASHTQTHTTENEFLLRKTLHLRLENYIFFLFSNTETWA